MVLGADSAYVINLERHKFRKRRIDHLISKLQLKNIEYIQGVDKFDKAREGFSFAKENLAENFWDPNGWLSLGILCCALSHRKAWKKFLDSGDEVGLFLEDDVKNTSYIHKLDFTQIRKELDNNKDWGVAIYGRYKKDIIRGDQVSNHFYNSLNINHQYSGHAYLLNKKSALWFYENTKEIQYAADICLEFSPFDIITLDKSIFVQRHIEFSFIEKEKRDKYNHIQEFSHTTISECWGPEYNNMWEVDKIRISKHIPAMSVVDKIRDMKGRRIKGKEIRIGDTNQLFGKVYRKNKR
jgi:GR25 family glycosyltransferase involved in LPS biosynthesis